ncbi:OB-fold protein [Flavisolibacter ginsenosidimutans]|uniref:DUF4369 domain-containing protein n=1 Tax=Flavisolibacter ginsenosidimutans TaxID=661481 RepID=A0A5B8UH31_9BACT|nr:hypothetical protein [Flavisolibacter ginsenosidimutans]QEC55370.1 hypothetical protein FSB75_05440 [Flavisolibacter ginsenosidimutans]
MKQSAFALTLLFCLLCVEAFCQTKTARQLYDEYHGNEFTFQQAYLNKNLTVTGKIRSIKKGIKGINEANAVFITATGYENFIVCQFPLDDTLPLMKLKADQTVTVTGNCKLIARDAMFLKDCSFSSSVSDVVKTLKAPADVPLGFYHIYQANGSTFNFQYKLSLDSYSKYTLNNEKGNLSYDQKTKVVRFTSGKLKGFTGIYRPVNPDNEKDPPTIVIDPKGFVPDLKHSYGKTYLLAYLQP